jgi:MFS family permease
VSQLYNRPFVLALLAQIGFVMANTLLAHYARWIAFLGGDVATVGWIMGVGSGLGLVLRPWIGQWIDRFGARTIWLAGFALFGIGTLCNLALQDTSFGIYACRSLIVLGASFVFSSSLAFIALEAPPDRRTEAIGILGVGGFLGMMLGPFLGDVILSGDRTRADFALLFGAAALALIPSAAILLMLHNPHTESRGKRVGLFDFVGNARQHWPGMVALVIVVFGLSMTSPFVFLTKYIDDVHIEIPGISEVGLFFLCYSGCGITVRVTLRRIPDLFGRRKMLLVGTVVMGTGMLLFNWVDAEHPWRLMAPALTCGAGHALMFHTGTSLFLDAFPSTLRGIGSALSLMVLDIGMIGGAPVLGLIAEFHGYGALFTTIGASCYVAGILYAISSIPVWRARARAASLGASHDE